MITSINNKNNKKKEKKWRAPENQSTLWKTNNESRQENKRISPKINSISINRQQFLKFKPQSSNKRRKKNYNEAKPTNQTLTHIQKASEQDWKQPNTWEIKLKLTLSLLRGNAAFPLLILGIIEVADPSFPSSPFSSTTSATSISAAKAATTKWYLSSLLKLRSTQLIDLPPLRCRIKGWHKEKILAVEEAAMGLKERREGRSWGWTEEVWAIVRDECIVGLQVAIVIGEERAQSVNRREEEEVSGSLSI